MDSSSAGGVSGISGLAADACASKGSSMRAKFNFLGGLRLEKRDANGAGDPGRVDRCELWRDRGLLR